MVKQQIKRVVFLTDHQMVLAADKGKPDPEFQQKALNVREQPLLDVAFLCLFTGA